MLIYILLFVVGRFFYKMAGDYGKNGWAYGILSIVTFYAGTNISAFFFILGIELLEIDFFYSSNEIILTLMAIPFGFLACWGLYKILQRNWGKEEKFDENIIDQIGQ